MDWISRNKLTGVLIGVLLLINIITIIIIWLLISREHREPFDKGKHPRGLEELQGQLGLSDEQVKQLDSLRKDNFERTRVLFELAGQIKRELAPSVFSSDLDTAAVNSKTRKIGATFEELDRLRFYYFREVVNVLTPEQQEKMKPLIKELFGERPPPRPPFERPERRR